VSMGQWGVMATKSSSAVVSPIALLAFLIVNGLIVGLIRFNSFYVRVCTMTPFNVGLI